MDNILTTMQQIEALSATDIEKIKLMLYEQAKWLETRLLALELDLRRCRGTVEHIACRLDDDLPADAE
jgi:hypothetical protein